MILARAEGALRFGTLPGVAPRFAAGLELSWGWPRLLALVELGPATDGEVARSAGGGHVALWNAALRGCGVFLRTGPGELGACGGLELGRLSAEAYGVDTLRSGSARWLAVDAGVTVRAPLVGGLAVGADAVGVFPLDRPTFVIEGLGEVHRPAAAGLRLGLGLSYRF